MEKCEWIFDNFFLPASVEKKKNPHFNFFTDASFLSSATTIPSYFLDLSVSLNVPLSKTSLCFSFGVQLYLLSVWLLRKCGKVEFCVFPNPLSNHKKGLERK